MYSMMHKKDFHETVFQATAAALIVMDPIGRIVAFNQSCERISGYCFEEVRGRKPWDFLLSSGGTGFFRKMFENLHASHFPNTHRTHWITKSGELRLMVWSNSILPGPDKAIAYVVSTCIDIIDQKIAHQTLEDLQSRQTAILNAISDSVFLKDIRLRHIEISRGFLERHGFERSQVIGRTARDIFPESEAAAIEERDMQVLRSGKPLRSEVIRTVSGEQRWYDVIRHPVIDNAGRVTGIAASSRDITNRKLVDARRSKREAMLRQTLIKEVHHRIKNNLQGVISLLDQLALKHPDLDEPLASLGKRLNTIALVHGLNNGMSGHDMNFCNVTAAITAAARALHGEDILSIAFEEGFQAIELDEDEAVPVALIVNEMISNALKHAAQDAPRPIAHIQLQRRPSAVKLHVRNFTGSLPGSFDFQKNIGLGTGLRLLKSLLPPTGVTLEINNCPAGGVEAIFTLTPPIVRENRTDNARQPQ